jgi:hypothetical protein
LSRLDSFLRRLKAQRECLNAAVGLVAGLPGPVLELGLGNGRTYDHMREICPEREIFVFERAVSAHPDSTPDPEHLFEGLLGDTLPAATQRFAGQVALVHADLGSGQAEIDAATSALISAALPPLLASGAIIVSDQKLNLGRAEDLPLPPGVSPGRYYLYRWP